MEKLTIPRYERDTNHPPVSLGGDWDEIPYRPNPDCDICGGSGFIHPRNQGSPDYARATPCRCLLASIAQYAHAGYIQRRDSTTDTDKTFSTFQSVEGAEKALRFAKQLANGESDFVWLLLYGGTGNGKTHLCHAIARVLLENEREVRFVMAADMFAELRGGIENNTVESLIREFKQAFFLIVDDWGVEYGSEWEQTKFDEIMTARFANARPTVLATNKDMADLPARLRSRFEDKVLARYVKNSAPDYRKSKRR